MIQKQEAGNDGWYSLNLDQETKVVANGAVVGIRKKQSNTVPLFCPCCQFPMRGMQDIISFKETKGCFLCDLTWLRPNRKAIEQNSQWHPSTAFPQQWLTWLEERNLKSKTTIRFE